MGPLYSAEEADALTKSEQTESWRISADRKKAELILKYAEGAESLLDIGCGWGQVLVQLAGKIAILAGVDESPERLAKLKNNNLNIKTYQCNSTKLSIEDESFDIVLTSHILHELQLFGRKGELKSTLKEIKRVMKPKGRYFIIDHVDPGEGQVTIALKKKQTELFDKFVDRYKYRKVQAVIKNGRVTLSKRNCQDFVTKLWAIDTSSEEMEMAEPHTIMRRNEIENDLKEIGLGVVEWITFNSIEELMAYYSIELVRGEPWNRQLMMIAEKIQKDKK